MHSMMPSECPGCGYKVDAATGVSGKGEPAEGDVSICLNCGAINIFKDFFGHLRRANALETAEIKTNPVVQRAVKIIQERGWIRTPKVAS